MNLNEFKEKLFDKAKESGFEDSEIYVTNSESLSISIYKQEVEGYNLEDRKSTRLNSSHVKRSRMPSSA